MDQWKHILYLPNNHVRQNTYSCRGQVFSEINQRLGDKIFKNKIWLVRVKKIVGCIFFKSSG